MPTIVLRHVTLRGDPQHAGEAAGIRHVGALTANADGALRHTAPMHTRSEQAERENIIDDLSLTIRDGETLSILGPSGCGKTPGEGHCRLIKPDSARYSTTAHDDETRWPIRDRMVFQIYALYPHLEARTTWFYDSSANAEKIRSASVTSSRSWAWRSTLADRKRPPCPRRTAAIAIGVPGPDPQLFLFDEPLSNLDACWGETRIQLKRLLRPTPITSVYVTSRPNEAIAWPIRIGDHERGQNFVRAARTRGSSNNTPGQRFIASFLQPRP